MKTSFYRFAALLLFAAALTAGCGERTDDMRLLYWNIQNGMWSATATISRRSLRRSI